MVFSLLSAYLVNLESRDVVGTLITNRHEPPGGIDGEYPWIVPERRGVAYLSKPAIVADRKNADGVACTVCPVDEVAIGGNADFRSEVGTGESRRHTRDDLLFGKRSRGGIETPEHDGGGFFLDGVHPNSVGVEREVPRPIARGGVHEGYRSRSQGRGGSEGQFPDVNPVLPRIRA